MLLPPGCQNIQDFPAHVSTRDNKVANNYQHPQYKSQRKSVLTEQATSSILSIVDQTRQSPAECICIHPAKSIL